MWRQLGDGQGVGSGSLLGVDMTQEEGGECDGRGDVLLLVPQRFVCGRRTHSRDFRLHIDDA